MWGIAATRQRSAPWLALRWRVLIKSFKGLTAGGDSGEIDLDEWAARHARGESPDPQEYLDRSVKVRVGDELERDTLLRRLVDIQYTRNDLSFARGTFRCGAAGGGL